VISYLFDPDSIFASNVRSCGVKQVIEASPRPKDAHAAVHYCRPLESLAIYVDAPRPRVHPNESDRETASRYMKMVGRGPVVAIHPGSGGEEIAETVPWSGGRTIRWWGRVTAFHRARQFNQCEMTYEISEADGTTRRVTERFPMRYLFRHEVEHLLARSGFRIVALYGDYDRSPYGDDSPELIVVAEPVA